MTESNISTNIDLAVGRLFEQLELASVNFQSVSAQARSVGNLGELAMEVGAAHALMGDRLLYRFQVDCKILGKPRKNGEDPAEFGKINLRLVCEFSTPSDFSPPADDAIEKFGDDVAFPIAGPYIREMISSLTMRLGFPTLTIGLFAPGENVPRTVTGRRAPRGD